MSAAYDGGLVFKSDDGSFELKFNGQLQARYELINRPTPTEADPDDTTTDSRFVLPRSRIAASATCGRTPSSRSSSRSPTPATRACATSTSTRCCSTASCRSARAVETPLQPQRDRLRLRHRVRREAITTPSAAAHRHRLTNGFDKSPDGHRVGHRAVQRNGDANPFPVTCTVPMARRLPHLHRRHADQHPGRELPPELQGAWAGTTAASAATARPISRVARCASRSA